MSIRPIWLILAGATAVHAAVFWSVQGFLVFPGFAPHEGSFVDFQVKPPVPAFPEAGPGLEPEIVLSTQPAGALPGQGGKQRIPSDLELSGPMLSAIPMPEGAAPLAQASVFETTAVTRRVVYLIDCSGSMFRAMGTETRFARACGEVRRSIAELSPAMEFNVIYFSGKTAALNPAMLYASGAAKRSAAEFLGAAPEMGGETDLLAGIGEALKLAPDSVFVITDGIANAQPWEVLDHLNALRKKHGLAVRIHTVGFDLRGDRTAEDLLRKIAGQTGGTYQRVAPPARPVATVQR
jgi:Mg-chelatase subunit ChlD